MYQTINQEAWNLVHSIATQCGTEHGFGTMSPAAYDTAWVAMTEKTGKDGNTQPLFPEAYEYLKQTQDEDGSWGADTSDADGIVNTLAALLALKRQHLQSEEARADNQHRCRVAEASLHRMLGRWNIETTDRVGLEVLVPNLLRLLEAEKISFEFPSRKQLMAMNAAKLGQLGQAITGPEQTTLIHTLEAFVGTLNLDKVKHHRMPNGSMLASPSSTAAYLMNSSVWDNEAEAYLQMVYEKGVEAGHKGGFPSAFPSTVFEISWVLETLLENGFSKEEFLLADIRKLTVCLENNLKIQKGIVGFAPSSLPDADDTAKSISTMRLLGWNPEVEPMLKAFEADASFVTYRGERNASTSANCNILSCLLRTTQPAKYTGQIIKCATFLTKSWMRNDGPDKWHVSVQYPMMLIAQALVLLLDRWGKNELEIEIVPKQLMYQDIPRTLLDILSRTMRLQHADGSWEGMREVTAYAVLTLAPLLSMPWIDFMKPEGTACMYRGKAYLENSRHQWRDAERVWVEKTVYSSSNLSLAYCLAASKVLIPEPTASQTVVSIFPPQLGKKMAKMTGFFAHVAPFSNAPKWKVQLSMLQSASYAAALRSSRYKIFPPIAGASDEKYQEYIPFTWIGCRDYLSSAISAETLWEMMLVSMFNFQVDAYMETVVWGKYQKKIPALKALIRDICSQTSHKRKRSIEDHTGGATKSALMSGPCSAGNINGNPGQTNGSSTNTNNGFAEDFCRSGATDYGQSKEILTGDDLILDGTADRVDRMGNGNQIKKPSNGISAVKKPVAPAQPASKDLNGGEISKPDEAADSVEGVLTKFVNYVLQHPRVLSSSPSMRSWIAHEMETFLLAHITHMEDCADLTTSSNAANDTLTWEKPRTTFFNWVRTTSADHTSCPYSFVFFLCLIGEGGKDVFASLQQRYMLEDACRHLATMCRQYNDFGSVLRDQEEMNLNSVNFPEFVRATDKDLTAKALAEQRKGDLLAIAQYERRCLEHIVGELELTLDSRVMEKLRLFIQVTDLYGHIYVARDIGIRREEEAQKVVGV